MGTLQPSTVSQRLPHFYLMLIFAGDQVDVYQHSARDARIRMPVGESARVGDASGSTGYLVRAQRGGCVHHSPGVNGLSALVNGRRLRATRPSHFFRPEN